MKRLKSIISPFITAIFVTIFIAYFIYNKDDFAPLLKLPVAGMLLIILIKISNQFVSGLFLKWSTEAFVGKMKFFDGLYVAILSALGNFFGPLLGGTSIRALYLKKVHKLPYSRFISTLFGYYVIVFFVNNLIAIISLLFINSLLTGPLFLFFGIWMIVILVVIFAKLPSRNKFQYFESYKLGKYFLTVLYDIEAGWVQLSRDKTLLLRLIGLTLIGAATAFLSIYVEMKMLNIETSLAGIGLYQSISATSMLFSITPAGLGFRESVLILTSSAIGISTNEVLQIAVVDRGLTFITLGILYLVSKLVKPKVFEDLS